MKVNVPIQLKLNRNSNQEGLKTQTNALITKWKVQFWDVDIDRKRNHGSLEQLVHPWIQNDYWSYRRVLSIVVWRYPVNNKEKTSTILVHNQSSITWLPSKCNIYKSLPQHNHMYISNIHNITNIYKQGTFSYLSNITFI